MTTPAQPNPPEHGQLLVYSAEDGQLKIDVRLEGETAWLTQAQMATLFQTTVPNVNMHLRNVFAEGELLANSVIQEFLITAADGKQYRTNHYNLDAIISIGYRVKSAVATRFRIWAITGQTAAEIIHDRADSTKPNMGLTNWRGAKVRKEDVTIAKNVLIPPDPLRSGYFAHGGSHTLAGRSTQMGDVRITVSGDIKICRPLLCCNTHMSSPQPQPIRGILLVPNCVPLAGQDRLDNPQTKEGETL